MSSDEKTDYGPLAGLVGSWEGDKGIDIAPEPDGSEENPYYERIDFEAAGDVDNAESQVLTIVRYHQVVRRKSNDEVFHNQVGFWTWDAASGTIAESFTIPRGVALVAGGSYEGPGAEGEVVLEVRAKLGDEDWGIAQSAFMREKASTEAFEHRIVLQGDTLRYSETTHLQIYGRSFEHSDDNELRRV